MKITVLDGYTLNPGDNPWDGLKELGDTVVYDRTPIDLIIEHSKDSEIILTNKTPLSAETIAQLPKLKFISVLATGYNVVDLNATVERGIPVSNVPIYGTDTVSQYVFAMLLEHCHHIGHHVNQVKGGKWTINPDWCFWDYPLIELVGLKMGIVGFGRIGRRTGELAHAFGMQVIASDIVHGPTPTYKPFAWKSNEELFSEADVISLHCPLTPENKGFVNRNILNRMKRTAILINTARGTLVNEQDLADALNEGLLAGAAVDVVSKEPIDVNNPLLRAKNIFITPHIAWGTLAARQRLLGTTIENIKGFLDGRPINVVNC